MYVHVHNCSAWIKIRSYMKSQTMHGHYEL